MSVRGLATAALGLAGWACSMGDGLDDRTVRLVGSDTELSATQRLAEAYRAAHPEVVVSVAGGGSGAGIAALLDGRTDVANSSREIRAEELALARERGLELDSIVLGLDALAVVVHPDNPVDALRLDELGRLYRGDVEGWAELGGEDRPVTLYGRQTNSGTFLFFRSRVLQGDYALGMRNLNGNAQVVESVRHDPGGVGYVGVGYVTDEAGRTSEGVRVLAIEASDGRRLHPRDADYPISRPLLQYFARPLRPVVAAFLEFELSEAGQAIVAGEGFDEAPRPSRERQRTRLSSEEPAQP